MAARKSAGQPKGLAAASALYRGVDSGRPVVIDPVPFVTKSRDTGWGGFLNAFLSWNEPAFHALALEPKVVTQKYGVRLELQPGLRAGAVPLRSAVTGKVAGGVVVAPRFDWAGVGRVLSTTGWGSGPEFLVLPLVPGSGREVPPWVLAGPVISRLSALLGSMRRGYIERDEVRRQPRGRIHWSTYLKRQRPSGCWHHLPCRFGELGDDEWLRQAIRWTLERLRTDLGAVGGADPLALSLIRHVLRLLELVADVPPRRPARQQLESIRRFEPAASEALRDGLRAIEWIVDERGLGGTSTADGLAWALSLEQLWERYVEHVIRESAARTGGQVRTGRLGETTVPLAWSDPTMRAPGHLVPDFVVYRSDGIEVVDAKYKSHFADLDEHRWYELAERAQSSLRADVHQVLAYTATAGAAERVKATLVYPVHPHLFQALKWLGRAENRTVMFVGTRQITLAMRALPFGDVSV